MNLIAAPYKRIAVGRREILRPPFNNNDHRKLQASQNKANRPTFEFGLRRQKNELRCCARGIQNKTLPTKASGSASHTAYVG